MTRTFANESSDQQGEQIVTEEGNPQPRNTGQSTGDVSIQIAKAPRPTDALERFEGWILRRFIKVN